MGNVVVRLVFLYLFVRTMNGVHVLLSLSQMKKFVNAIYPIQLQRLLCSAGLNRLNKLMS